MTANGSQAAPPDHGSGPDDASGLGPFGKGAALVGAATAALAALPRAVDAIAALLRDPAMATAEIAVAVASVRRLVEGAAAPDGRNLLVRRRGEPARFLVFGLARQLSGALGVQPIEIDTAAIALADPDAGVLDRLEAAAARDEPGHTGLRDPLATLRARIGAATSRLSIVKARLDVQAGFLTAMFATEAAAPLAELASDLDGDGARRVALDLRRQLGGHGLTTSGDGHGAVRDLFGLRGPS